MIVLKYAKENDLADFYIQCKGLHSGRPLQKYIPNSFAVFGAGAYDFERCFCIWKSKAYYSLIIGSVIPFIKIKDARLLIGLHFENLQNEKIERILAIRNINELIFNSRMKIEKLKELQTALALDVLKV